METKFGSLTPNQLAAILEKAAYGPEADQYLSKDESDGGLKRHQIDNIARDQTDQLNNLAYQATYSHTTPQDFGTFTSKGIVGQNFTEQGAIGKHLPAGLRNTLAPLFNRTPPAPPPVQVNMTPVSPEVNNQALALKDKSLAINPAAPQSEFAQQFKKSVVPFGSATDVSGASKVTKAPVFPVSVAAGGSNGGVSTQTLPVMRTGNITPQPLPDSSMAKLPPAWPLSGIKTPTLGKQGAEEHHRARNIALGAGGAIAALAALYGGKKVVGAGVQEYNKLYHPSLGDQVMGDYSPVEQLLGGHSLLQQLKTH